MSLATFDAVLYAVTFLVPGFIWSSVLSILIPRRTTAPEVRGLEFLTLSCLNHALWIWLLVPLFRTGFLDRHAVWGGIMLVFPVLLSPIALGLATGVLYQREWAKQLFSRFGFRTIDPIPTAWDYHFGRGHPYWVVVTLRDGSESFGLYGYRSFAGSDPNERDLYLEAVFRPTATGDWAPVEDSGGIILKAGEIVAIEFRKHPEIEYD